MFFIGMCLWGSQRVTTLKHSHSTVLPSMLQVSVYFVVVDVVVVERSSVLRWNVSVGLTEGHNT